MCVRALVRPCLCVRCSVRAWSVWLERGAMARRGFAVARARHDLVPNSRAPFDSRRPLTGGR